MKLILSVEKIKETYADSRNWDNENFKKAIALLIEYFKKYNQEHQEQKKDYNSEYYNLHKHEIYQQVVCANCGKEGNWKHMLKH